MNLLKFRIILHMNIYFIMYAKYASFLIIMVCHNDMPDPQTLPYISMVNVANVSLQVAYLILKQCKLQ